MVEAYTQYSASQVTIQNEDNPVFEGSPIEPDAYRHIEQVIFFE